MSSNAEDKEMEAQALEAIFDTQFQIVSPTEWVIDIYPEPSALLSEDDNNNNNDTTNHVACKLHVTLPTEYPESVIPELKIEIIKGLALEHQEQIQQLAIQEATNQFGTPSIFAIVECIREWLVNNNMKGLDDISMHAIMLRKEKEKSNQQQKLQQESNTIYESHLATDEMTQAELEELIVSKRRAEGTPCTKENFLIWQETFDKEMEQQRNESEQQENDNSTGYKKSVSNVAATNNNNKIVDKSHRLTGFQYFSDKTNNYEALEAAAERAESAANAAAEAGDDDDDDDEDIDEELFDDDVDLDDLSFDDEDGNDDDDDDDDEDVNI